MCSFLSSSLTSEVTAELPMLALILQRRCDADRHRLELGMIDVGRDDHAAAGDFVADELGRQLFLVGNERHLFRDGALARVVHLGKIAGRVLFLAAGEPFCAGLGDVVTVAAVAIGGSHENPSSLKIR